MRFMMVLRLLENVSHCWREVLGDYVRVVNECPTVALLARRRGVLCWLFWNQTTVPVDIMDHSFLEVSSRVVLCSE
jgi:hypothetical protein